MSSTRANSEKRRQKDLYVTPMGCITSLARELLHSCVMPPGRVLRILDPGSGDGRIAVVFAEKFPWAFTVAVDISHPPLTHPPPRGQIVTGDFLAIDRYDKTGGIEKFDLIVSNPPFSLAQEFIEHSMTLLADDGIAVFLLNMNFFGSKKRLPFWFAHQPSFMRVLSPRPSFTEGGNDSVDYAWVGWGGHSQINPFGWYDWKVSDGTQD